MLWLLKAEYDSWIDPLNLMNSNLFFFKLFISILTEVLAKLMTPISTIFVSYECLSQRSIFD